MGYLTNVQVVEATRNRAEIETGLAKNLYGVFNRDPIIGDLRRLMGHALANFIPFINDNPGNEPFVKRLKSDEHRNLEVLTFGTTLPPYPNAMGARSNLTRVYDCRNEWEAKHVSDIVRLLGDLCEQLKGVATINAEDFKTIKPPRYFENVDPVKSKTAYQAGTFTSQDTHEQYPVSRTRVKEKQAQDSDWKDMPSPRHIAEGRQVIKELRMGGQYKKSFWGIGTVRLMPKNTARKVDIAFGLPEGAAESGTTADSILMMNRVKSFTSAFQAAGIELYGTVPEYLLQLLPLVTMVAQGHHTLFESAFTLSYHNYVNYAIGFYDTLMPEPAQLGNFAVSEIRSLLQTATEDDRNIHCLCYYDETSKQYVGYQFETPSELSAFRKFASLRGEPARTRNGERLEWMDQFQNVSPLVTARDLKGIGAPLPAFAGKDFIYYSPMHRGSFRRKEDGSYEDKEGKIYKKCEASDKGAFAIVLSANQVHCHIRPA